MAATLTLSTVEQAAVLNHLRIQHSRLVSNSGDAIALQILLGQIGHSKVITLTRVEAVVMLRYLRHQATALTRDMMALEERRMRGGFNGHLDNAHRALDADRTVLEDVIRRLWEIII